MHSLCMSLSSSQALTHKPYMGYLLCHFFSFSLPSSYTLIFSLLPLAVSVSLSFSCCYALLSFSIWTLKFPCANVVRLSQLGCLCVFFSLLHYFSWSLAAFLSACVSVSISLCLYISVCICLPLPPTLHLSLSALLRLSINVLMRLLTSDVFLKCLFLYFCFLLLDAIVVHFHNALLHSLSFCRCALLPSPPDWVTVLQSHMCSSDLCESLLFQKVSLRLPLTCMGRMMIYYF